MIDLFSNQQSYCNHVLLWLLLIIIQPVSAIGVEVIEQSENLQLISLQADHQPLNDVLHEICKSANVQLALYGTFPSEISVNFEKLALKQAILRLVSNNSRILMITYADSAGTQADVIESIVIYADDQPGPVKTVIDFGQSVDEQLDYLEHLASGPEYEAIPEIAKILSARDEASVVKHRAIEILTSFSSDQVAETLASGLSDQRTELRSSIINALGQLNNQQSSLILGQVLFAEQDHDIRLLAVEQLTTFETPAAKAFLKSAAEDTNQQIQTEAKYALDVLEAQ